MSTGRFFVYTKSGRTFCVEPWGDPHIEWGNYIPGKKNPEKVEPKDFDMIDESNSVISKENGYKNIAMLSPGTSPLGYIDALDQSGVERIESKFVKYLD